MRNLRTLSRRAGALLLAGVTLLSSTALAVGDGVTPTYDEAYYGTLDYYGNLTEGSVVKSYILNGATSITDYGTYDGVDNLTNATVPSRNGSATTFDFGDSAPSHFYFEGKTAKPFEALPWTLSVKYLLNGVPTKAENLAGKTGMVEIDVDAIPNKSVSDYVRHNYTLAVTTLFNQDNILSLEAPGAQVQLVGNLRAVLFLALPGEERHFEIRVGAEDFEFTGLTFLLVPATLSQVEDLSDLAKQKEDLEDYYKRLSGSLDDLLDSFDGMSSTLSATAGGLDQLNRARGTVSAGKGQVYSDADELRTDLDRVKILLEPVSGHLADTSQALTDATAALDSLTGQVSGLREDTEALRLNLKDLQNELKIAKDNLTAIQKSLKDLDKSTDDLDADVDKLKKNLSDLAKDAKAMKEELEDLQGYELNLRIMVGHIEGMQSTLNGLKGSFGALSGMSTDLTDNMNIATKLHNGFVAGNNGSALTTPLQFFVAALNYKNKSAAQAAVLYSALDMDTTAVATAIGTNAALVGITDAATISALGQNVGGLNQVYTVASGAATAAGENLLTMSDSTKATIITTLVGAGLEQATAVEYLTNVVTGVGLKYFYATVTSNGATPMDFQTFLYAMMLANGDNDTDAKSHAESLYNLYGSSSSLNTSALSGLANRSGTLMGELASTIGSVDLEDLLEDTDELVTATTSMLQVIGDLSTTLGSMVDGIDDAIDAAGDLVDTTDRSLDDAKATLDVVSGLLDITDGLLAKAPGMLDDLDRLDGVADVYEPTLHEMLKNLDTTAAVLNLTTDHLSTLYDTSKSLLQTAGNQLDAGTQASLGGLSDALRKAAGSFDAGHGVREAKDSINDIIEDIWDDVTGDKMDVLDMDATANPVSLTDARNPAPQSVQVILRTQEIKVEDDADDAGSDAGQAVAAPATFLDRLVAIFKGIWAAITGLFHR